MQPLCEANLSLHACWHDFAVLVSVTFSLIHSFKDKEDIVICVISRTESNLFFAFSFIDVQNTSILSYVPEYTSTDVMFALNRDCELELQVVLH